MDKHILKAEIRNLTGRKVKKIRTEGFIPATIYGKALKSLSISVKADEFIKVFQKVGETGLIDLQIGKESRPVLINSFQVDPVYSKPVHIEFHQVNLKEKVKANIPVVVVGEAQAVKDKVGVVLTITNEIEVEALPSDLPENISVDVTSLVAINDELKISDIKVPTGVVVLSDPEQILVRIAALVTKETEAEVKVEAAALEAKAEQSAASAGVPTEDVKTEIQADKSKTKTE